MPADKHFKPLGPDSREASPEQHDAEAIAPGATEKEIGLITAFPYPAGPWVVLGCGTGRHVRGLRQRGFAVSGLDADPAMLSRAQERDDAHRNTYHLARLEQPWPIPQPSVAVLLNHTLTVLHDPAIAAGFFLQAATALPTGGLLIIDDPGPMLWQSITDGHLIPGCDATGSEQCIFLSGDNRFIWRRGEDVDLDHWHAKPQDRYYRIWSESELLTITLLAGFEQIDSTSYELRPEEPRLLRCFRRTTSRTLQSSE